MADKHGTFRADLHIHTRVSSDGIDRPEVVVAAAKKRGLHAIAITDHDRCAGYQRLVRIGLADPAGLPVDGLLVMPGVEVSTAQGHILVIGATLDSKAAVGVGVTAAAMHTSQAPSAERTRSSRRASSRRGRCWTPSPPAARRSCRASTARRNLCAPGCGAGSPGRGC